MAPPWIRSLFWIYLLILVCADATTHNWADPDLWHRLALGEYLAQHAHFPPGGTFSYLADYKDIADHEWGSAVIFYGLYRVTGGGDLFGSVMVLFKIITFAITITLVVCGGLRQRAPSAPAAAFYAVVLLALLPSFASTLRCVAFTHIFFALWLYWFQAERQGTRIPTWAYLASVIVWANLHGGFAIGLLWLGMVAAVEFWQRGSWHKWVLRLVLCTLATLINPFGWHLWVSTLRALHAPRSGFSEWAPITWYSFDFAGYKILLFVTVIALHYLLRRRHERKIDVPAVTLILALLLISLTSGRQTSLFALAVGVLLPNALPVSPRASRIHSPLRRLAYLGLCSMCILLPFYAVLMIPSDRLRLKLNSDSCPVGAIHFLQENKVQGNLLTPFNYGSYAMWELRGKMRVSMDGRYDLVYKPATYNRVADFYWGKTAGASLLMMPRPDAILVPLQDKVYSQLASNTGWKEAYRNSEDAVFLPR